MKESNDSPSQDSPAGRRRFLENAATIGMTAGLAAGYGTFCFMGARFLFPAKTDEMNWQFVATVDELAAGDSIEFTSPTGQQVVVARKSDGLDPQVDFVALSSVCPHLGC